jgi:hypothetical protein
MERLRVRKEEIASEKMRDEWAALKYRMMNAQDQDEQEKERVLEVGENGNEDSYEEKEEKEEEVEGRFYTQLELANSTDAKRGLLNWVMQMEYAGQTFFDGYVFLLLLLVPLLLSFLAVLSRSCSLVFQIGYDAFESDIDVT